MDMFWWKTVSYSAFMAIVGFLQTILTVRQMESTSTPNVCPCGFLDAIFSLNKNVHIAQSIARVSYWTISLQGGMDSYSFVTHLTLGSVVDPRASYALLLPAFFAALSGLLFGLRYAASIRVATAPSPAAPPPPPPSAAQNAGQAAVRRAERNENEDLPEEETAPPSQVESAWRFFWRPDSPACESICVSNFYLQTDLCTGLFLFVGAGSLILYIIISIGILPCAVAGIYSFWRACQ